MSGQSTEVIIALGSNLGNPSAQLETAIERIRQIAAIEAVSPIYRTAPVGYADQPDFLNAVVVGRTVATVFDLHRALQQIEIEAGRQRDIPNGPRPIDLDLLAFGPLKWHSSELIIPHPRLHQRAFVLAPLADIHPGWVHPQRHTSTTEMLADLGDLAGIERLT